MLVRDIESKKKKKFREGIETDKQFCLMTEIL